MKRILGILAVVVLLIGGMWGFYTQSNKNVAVETIGYGNCDVAVATQKLADFRAKAVSEEEKRNSAQEIATMVAVKKIQSAVLSHLRPATVEDYKVWLCEYLQQNQQNDKNIVLEENPMEYASYVFDSPSSYYHSYTLIGWYVAKESFTMLPSINFTGDNYSASVKLNIIVPVGIKVERNKLGSSKLYFIDDCRVESDEKIEIPIYSDINFENQNVAQK